MQISIKATNLLLTPSIKAYTEEKVGNLEKYLGKIDIAKVELERDRHHKGGDVMRAEVMLIVGGITFRADASSEDMFASVDMTIPKLKEQIAKFKDRRTTLRRRGARKAKKKR